MPKLLTTTEAAKLTGVSPSTVKSWCLRGEIPARRTSTLSGARYLIDPRDLAVFAEQLRKMGTGPGRPRKVLTAF